MHIVHVFFNVKKEYIDKFKEISKQNAENSLREEGIVRFDVMQEQDNNCRFILQEIYLSPGEQLKHRETEHFKKWKSQVNDLLEEEYTFIKYTNVFPVDNVF
jgi:quinol monooxygenase YgiN